MVVKASVSISDQQESFARRLVDEGRFSSLSAVVQQGIELLRRETELKDAELAALKKLLEQRVNGDFLTVEESDRQIDAMIAEKKLSFGL